MPAFPRIKLSSLRRRNVDFCSGNPSAFSDSAVDDNKRQKVTKKDAACGTDSPVESRVETSQKTIGQSQEDVRSTVPATAACGDDSFVGQECLKDSFYDVPCEQLATALLGKVLVRRLENGQILKGRIVETECYLGGEDKASHSYRGKMTERNAPMFMKPGTAYVYFTYGMYHCFNISSQGAGAAVLVRAVEPLEGVDAMAELRARGAKKKKAAKDKPPPKGLKPHELCSGPSKLCIAFDIDKDSCNKRDLTSWPGLCVCQGGGAHRQDDQDRVGDHGQDAAVVVTKRVGIDSAGRDWADKPLRFYLMGNPAVSKRDRAKEKELAAKAAKAASPQP
ncbi:DNA-3-methyladenine glycosylase-like isoform X1 [Thrips palmi]|uniref:DNA-3-methyladenine glycosylase n=1 Tax=Thrips palmi TaxID=161013 RepID=A0A6P8YQQ1_THRPL|nr:DNA-3-methyladenine glycosylase-like isoform X1 [Thrips palmi]